MRRIHFGIFFLASVAALAGAHQLSLPDDAAEATDSVARGDDGGHARSARRARRSGHADRTAGAAPAPDALAAAEQSSDEPSLRVAVLEARQAEARDDARYQATRKPNGLRADNPAQRYRVEYQRGRVAVETNDGAAKVSLSTARFGCGDATSEARASDVAVSADDARRVSIPRESDRVRAEEWFLNGTAGLEQGYTVASASCGAEPLVFEVALAGLAPRMEDGAIVLSDAGGRDRLAYGQLYAKDADGRMLETRLALEGTVARVEVDTAGARFPLVVDPLLVNLEAVLAPDSTGYGTSGMQFASSLAISGNTAVAAAPTDVYGGSVYIFVRSGTTWTLQQRILNPSYDPGGTLFYGGFGASVAVSGDTLAVGVRDYVTDFIDGEVYGLGSINVYQRTSGVWSLQATLVRGSGQGQAVDQGFGLNVSIDGDVLAAGAPYENTSRGAVYVFRRVTTTWQTPTRIMPSLQQSGARFGTDVALSGDLLAVGEPGRSVVTTQGAAYLFTYSGGVWSQRPMFSAGDGAAGDSFGESIDVDAATSRIIVGAPGDDGSVTDAGSAYVFVYSGPTVTQEAKIAPSTTTVTSRCGNDVAIADPIVLVGCPNKSPAGAQTGAAHVYTRSGTSWTDGGVRTGAHSVTYDWVGHSVALDGTLGLVGAPRWDEVGRQEMGEFLVYSGSSMTFETYVSAGRSAHEDRFGGDVAASGSTVVVGVPNHATGLNTQSGAVYVFLRTGAGTYTLQAKLLSPTTTADRFGDAVDIDGDVLVVGAPNHNPGSTPVAGAVYVYRRSGTLWSSPTKLLASTPSSSANFGYAVALSGPSLIVGEYAYDNGSVFNTGRVHFFEWNGTSWSGAGTVLPTGAATGNFIGESVDIHGSIAIAGAPRVAISPITNVGAAYVFRRSTTLPPTWSASGTRLTAPVPASNQLFGTSVAVRDTTVLVGAPGDASSRGNVYVFRNSGGNVTSAATLSPASPVTAEAFGTSLAFDGSVLLVGSNARARYYYGTDVSFTEQGTITPPAAFGGAGSFGASIAAVPGFAFIGAPTMSGGNTPNEGRVTAHTVAGFNGFACSTNTQCGSGFCVDGVCCDGACGGGATNDCQACSVAAGGGTNGTCTAVVVGRDPCRPADASGCDVAESCDGTSLVCPVDGKAANGTQCGGAPSGTCDAQDTCQAGTCQPVYASSATQCAAGSCTNGTAISPSFCSGSSNTCSSGTPTSCGAYACGATACLTSCSGDAQCNAAYYCNTTNMQCAAKLVDGQACTSPNQCQSGMCAGVCGGDVDECALGTDNCNANATCTNTVGSFTCACNSGFTGNGVTCNDVNECLTNNGGCAPAAAATCTNTPGSRTCACNSGYTGDGVTCTDINECLVSNGGCSTSPFVTCTNTPGSRTCASCPTGYSGDGMTCTNVNECLSNNGGCSTNPLVNCTDTEGSRICGGCPSGYTGNGVTCTDTDECTLGTDNCDVNATCSNTPGSFACTCNGGYAGSGQSCTDVNECTAGTDNCSANATCSNVPGTFTCSCNTGFTGNGVTCTDVNECLTNNGGCSTSPMVTCTNTPGSRTCAACPTGYSGDGTTCTNVNECSVGTDTCTATQACTDTTGSFTCTNCDANASVQNVGGVEACVCNTGYGGNGQTCTANACSPSCGTGANCNASFTCVCPTGYGGNPLVACTDLNECTLGTDTCATNATCTNTPGWYACACATGFAGDGETCTDIDECSDGTDDCGANAFCTNVAGGFECSCSAGYTGDGYTCVLTGSDAGTDASVSDSGVSDSGVSDAGTDATTQTDSGSDSGTPPDLRSAPSVGLCTVTPPGRGTGGGHGLAVGLLVAAVLLGRRRARARLGGVALAVGLALASTASVEAQTTDESVARAQFQLGQAYLNEGRFHEAAVAFEAAYAASRRPQLLHNAYVAYRDAQELENAASALRRFLEADPSSDTPLMRGRLEAIENQLAAQRAAAEAAERARLAEEQRRATSGDATTTTDTTSTTTDSSAAPVEEQTSSSGRGLAFGLIGGGAGVAAIGMLGGGLGASAQSDRLRDYCGAPVGLPAGQCFDVAAVDDISSKTTMFRAIAWGSLAVGLGTAAVGTVLLFTGGDDEDETAAVSAAPVCTRDGCSLAVFGRF